MRDLSKSYSVDNGISFNDFANMFEGIENPLDGISAPIGSIFVKYDTGKIYQKTGSADTAWEELLKTQTTQQGTDVDIDCGSFIAPNENVEIDCRSFI